MSRFLESKQRRLAKSLPSSLSGAVAKESGDLEGALRYWTEAMREDPNNKGVAYEVADTLTRLHRQDQLKEFVVQSRLDDGDKAYFLLHANDNEGARKSVV